MFPFGSSIMNSPIGLMILPFQKVLAKTWYYLWHPYALFFTHRGITHWPIISTYIRVFYLQLWIFLLLLLTSILSIQNDLIVKINLFLNLFYPSSQFFLKPIWIIFCLPVFLVDIFHEFIDFVDSKRKGLSYCPPQIPRGYLSNFIELVKKLLTTKN
jgi:uncharacterized metal-binding protein